jgi:PilZ domain
LRKGIRYRLDAAAIFSWEGGSRGCFHGEGITRDISAQGAFILTATMPPPGSLIHVDLFLPSLSTTNVDVRITGEARVIRVDYQSTDSWIHGFAVATDDLNQWGLTVNSGQAEVSSAEATTPN